MFSWLAAISQQQGLCDRSYKFEARRSICLRFYAGCMCSICLAYWTSVRLKIYFLVTAADCSHPTQTDQWPYLLQWWRFNLDMTLACQTKSLWGAQTRRAPRRTWNKTPALRTRGGLGRKTSFATDMSEPWAAPGPDLPEERWVETTPTATVASGFTKETDVTYQTNQRDC